MVAPVYPFKATAEAISEGVTVYKSGHTKAPIKPPYIRLAATKPEQIQVPDFRKQIRSGSRISRAQERIVVKP
jgi:hypothetical protein